MSTITTNYKLVKPALSDVANIEAMNPNWDTIDAQLGIASKFAATNIAESTDLNTITTPGVYNCPLSATVSTLTNAPTTVAFAMLVLEHTASGVVQEVFEYSTFKPKVYYRNKHGDTWSTWSGIYTTDNKPTVTDIGLDKVNNTSDADKPISTATQTALNGKQATITGAATTITDSNLTANRAVVSNSSGKVGVTNVTSTELGYLSGTTSKVQTQLNNKLNLTGGNLSGSIDVISDDFRAIGKRRTVNGVEYLANYGCGILGGKGIACVELQRAGTVLGRIEIGEYGVSYVDTNNKRHYLHKTAVVTATLE